MPADAHIPFALVCSDGGADSEGVAIDDWAVKKQKSRRCRLGVCALSGLAVSALFAVTLLCQAPGPASTRGEPSAATSFVEEKQMFPLPLPYECSKPEINNCHISQCCLDFGYQCYSKNETFAACLKTCDKGALMKAGNGSWSCNKLGLERRCAKTGENCKSFGCCAEAGHQCYTKDNYSASCKTSCEPGAGWSCDPIGTQYTPDYYIDYTPDYSNSTLVEPWIKNCSHIGESCAETKCCSFTGYNCYEKNKTWASCLSACIPEKANGGISEKPVVQVGKPVSNPPPHNLPTFTYASPGPWSCKRLSRPETPSYLDGASLFCFTYALDDHGKGQTEDFQLLHAAQKANTSVFACDHWAVFSDKEVPLSPGKTTVVEFPKIMKRPNTKVWVNLDLFVNMWKSIKYEGTWAAFPWIVKADLYTVFIPSRLRMLLVRQPVTSEGVYMENCKGVRMGFHGSLEVISNLAFGKLLSNLDWCKTQLPITNGTHTHFKYYGEDKFAAWCMHKRNVSRVPSRQEVAQVPANEKIQGLHLTESCPTHTLKQVADSRSKKWMPNCTKVKTAGMHSFQKVTQYMRCLKETRQDEF